MSMMWGSRDIAFKNVISVDQNNSATETVGKKNQEDFVD